MPFIPKSRREQIDGGFFNEAELTPGDRCYRHYKRMKQRWDENPRWTTAHEIYRDRSDDWDAGVEEDVAWDLAWQVFFNLHVMPYEICKRDENGEVE